MQPLRPLHSGLGPPLPLPPPLLQALDAPALNQPPGAAHRSSVGRPRPRGLVLRGVCPALSPALPPTRTLPEPSRIPKPRTKVPAAPRPG